MFRPKRMVVRSDAIPRTELELSPLGRIELNVDRDFPEKRRTMWSRNLGKGLDAGHKGVEKTLRQ
jgi:hypothetical protein